MELVCNSFITSLPPELLLQIFHIGEQGLLNKLSLTHVCRTWRHLACNAPTLWRSFMIVAGRGTTESKLDSTISLLQLQLQRSKGVPLDVYWYGEGSADENSRLLRLIRCEAPFNRWKSLSLSIESFPCADVYTPAVPDAFLHLETLTVYGPISGHTVIHDLLEKTTTTKLQSVDFLVQGDATADTLFDEIRSRYCGILGRVRSVGLPFVEHSPRSPVHLPVNVLDLRATYSYYHHWPHIRRYRLEIFFVDRVSTQNFGSLTELSVDLDMYVCHGDCVVFPSLVECTVGAVWFRLESGVSAPLLQTFRFARRGPPDTPGAYSYWEEGLASPRFKMIPSKRLELDMTFRDEVLPGLVERCSTIKFLSINLGNRELLGQKLLFQALGVETGEITTKKHPTMPVPKMKELRLEFGWSLRDVDGWKAWAARLLDARLDLGKNVSVLASWKGEGVFVRLA